MDDPSNRSGWSGVRGVGGGGDDADRDSAPTPCDAGVLGQMVTAATERSRGVADDITWYSGASFVARRKRGQECFPHLSTPLDRAVDMATPPWRASGVPA